MSVNWPVNKVNSYLISELLLTVIANARAFYSCPPGVIFYFAVM